MDSVDPADAQPAAGVEDELSRLGRVVESFSRRIQAVERRLSHTEGCQQAQELEIHEMRHTLDKVSKQEVPAKEAELSEGLVQLREQVRGLIDFMAQAQVGVRGFTAADAEKEAAETPGYRQSMDVPYEPRIAWQNAQSEMNQRLRRVFSPPSFIPEPEKPDTRGPEEGTNANMSTVKVCPPQSEGDPEKTTPQVTETMRASRASVPAAQRSVSCGGVAAGYHSRPCAMSPGVRVLSGHISPAPAYLNGASTPAAHAANKPVQTMSGPYFPGGAQMAPTAMVPMRCQRRSAPPEQSPTMMPSSHSMQVRPPQTMVRPLPPFGVRPHYQI